MNEPRNLLASLLCRKLNPAERRSLAEQLRALADEQDRLAEAEERSGPALRRVEFAAAPRKTGRPKGSGARFLRWEPPTGEGKASRRSGQLHIGRALYQELGEPERIDVQRSGQTLYLRPCLAGQGWKVNRGKNTMPRLNIGEEPADTLRLRETRYPAEIRDGAIIAIDPEVKR